MLALFLSLGGALIFIGAFIACLCRKTRMTLKQDGEKVFPQPAELIETAVCLSGESLGNLSGGGAVKAYAAHEYLKTLYPRIFTQLSVINCENSLVMQYKGLYGRRKPLVLFTAITRPREVSAIFDGIASLLDRQFQPQTDVYIVVLFSEKNCNGAAEFFERLGGIGLAVVPTAEYGDFCCEIATLFKTKIKLTFSEERAASKFLLKLHGKKLAKFSGTDDAVRAQRGGLSKLKKLVLCNPKVLAPIYKRAAASLPCRTCGYPETEFIRLDRDKSGITCELDLYTYFGQDERLCAARVQKIAKKALSCEAEYIGAKQTPVDAESYGYRYNEQLFDRIFAGERLIPVAARQNAVADRIGGLCDDVIRFSPASCNRASQARAATYYAECVKDWK